MKKITIFTAALALLLALSGCAGGAAGSGTPAEEQSKLEQIKSAGRLTMYTNPEFKPYEFVEGNSIVGVDVEIGKAIAAKIGVELDVVSAEFGGIVASIASGKGDIALSGITITEGRKQEVDFSTPYVDSIQYIIVPEDSGLEFMEQLSGLTIGAQLGTTGAMFVETEIEEGVLVGTDAVLNTYNSAPSAMQDMITGRVDVVVIDELVAIANAAENPGYMAVPFKYQSGAAVTEQFGACVAKGNDDLLAVINETVEELLSNGDIDRFFEMFEE